MLLEKPRKLLHHELWRVPKCRLREDILGLIEHRLFDDAIERATRSDPLAFWIMPRGRLKLLRCPIVYQSADVQFIDKNASHFRTIPFASAG